MFVCVVCIYILYIYITQHIYLYIVVCLCLCDVCVCVYVCVIHVGHSQAFQTSPSSTLHCHSLQASVQQNLKYLLSTVEPAHC